MKHSDRLENWHLLIDVLSLELCTKKTIRSKVKIIFCRIHSAATTNQSRSCLIRLIRLIRTSCSRRPSRRFSSRWGMVQRVKISEPLFKILAVSTQLPKWTFKLLVPHELDTDKQVATLTFSLLLYIAKLGTWHILHNNKIIDANACQCPGLGSKYLMFKSCTYL